MLFSFEQNQCYYAFYFCSEHLDMLQLEFMVSFQVDRTSQKNNTENIRNVFIFWDLKQTYLID